MTIEQVYLDYASLDADTRSLVQELDAELDLVAISMRELANADCLIASKLPEEVPV